MQDDSVDLWATDEVHFQQHGSRCRMWIPPEIKDPVLLHAPTRKSVGYFGAVRLRDGRFVFRLETGKFNGASFLQFLQQLRSASRGTRRRVVVISDNARYHHSRLHRPWRDQHAHDFALDFLPPVQSRTQSDRASVEAHTPSLPAQSLLRKSPRRHQCG
jgi:DDE superfamily endonuclease